MGKSLILVGGYTFSKPTNGNNWVCSTKNRACKAKLKLDDAGYIIKIYNQHSHPPRKFIKTTTGEFIRV
ncbi:unnamed protein product [Parnassius mnemosyne]|uniref:FLYWCH-type domain-containing protein n=1 Tax=Parnassius mnemosyne TaxID=213953 RepID=A0AAV1KBB6_9NEOP